MTSMRVVVVPVLADNYAYLLIDDSSKQAAVLDPAEPALVLAAAQKEGVNISSVLTTHHHADHAGGNQEMAQKISGLKVYGGKLDKVSACTNNLDHNDTFQVGAVSVTALHTPGHTRGSMCYYCTDSSGNKAVFTGDTMFVGGCGRLFECSYEDLYRSLADVLGKLPPETQVYVGHEYTIKNLEFAVAVDKSNDSLKQMLGWAKEQRLGRKFTVPTTLRNEWLINPFLRAGDESMKSVCPGCSPVDVFTKLRQQKDRF